MQRKRGELGPIGEALADLSGPLQARHHFTRFDQVDQLVGASEANPERGFMARMMTLCSPSDGFSAADHTGNMWTFHSAAPPIIRPESEPSRRDKYRR